MDYYSFRQLSIFSILILGEVLVHRRKVLKNLKPLFFDFLVLCYGVSYNVILPRNSTFTIQSIIIFILNYLIGIIISIALINLTCEIAYKKAVGFFIFKVSLDNILVGTCEELIWRIICTNTALTLVDLDKNSWYLIIFIMVITSIGFTSSHEIRKSKDYLEMFLYSMLLGVTCFLFPGMNFGLHTGRNGIVSTMGRRINCEK